MSYETFQHLGGKVHYVIHWHWELLWTLCGVPIPRDRNGWIKTEPGAPQESICKRCVKIKEKNKP